MKVMLFVGHYFLNSEQKDTRKQEARELLEVANDVNATYEEILSKICTIFDSTSPHKQALCRYLIAQLTNQDLTYLEQLSEGDFEQIKLDNNRALRFTLNNVSLYGK